MPNFGEPDARSNLARHLVLEGVYSSSQVLTGMLCRVPAGIGDQHEAVWCMMWCNQADIQEHPASSPPSWRLRLPDGEVMGLDLLIAAVGSQDVELVVAHRQSSLGLPTEGARTTHGGWSRSREFSSARTVKGVFVG